MTRFTQLSQHPSSVCLNHFPAKNPRTDSANWLIDVRLKTTFHHKWYLSKIYIVQRAPNFSEFLKITLSNLLYWRNVWKVGQQQWCKDHRENLRCIRWSGNELHNVHCHVTVSNISYLSDTEINETCIEIFQSRWKPSLP